MSHRPTTTAEADRFSEDLCELVARARVNCPRPEKVYPPIPRDWNYDMLAREMRNP